MWPLIDRSIMQTATDLCNENFLDILHANICPFAKIEKQIHPSVSSVHVLGCRRTVLTADDPTNIGE